MKPTIRVMPGELNRIVDASERELAHTRRFYQRGGLIVTVVTDPATREARVQEISLPALVRALAGAASWEKYDVRAQDWVRIDPPARHAGVLFDSTSYDYLPVLHGLTRQPYLRSDGSLMMTAGYDPASGMFGVFDAREFSVPESPSREQAEAALAVLRDLLTEFKFRCGSDAAAALSAMLTASGPTHSRPCADVPCAGARVRLRKVVPLRTDHGLCYAAARHANYIPLRQRGMPETPPRRAVASSCSDRVR